MKTIESLGCGLYAGKYGKCFFPEDDPQLSIGCCDSDHSNEETNEDGVDNNII